VKTCARRIAALLTGADVLTHTLPYGTRAAARRATRES